jgi:hypothetical protein
VKSLAGAGEHIAPRRPAMLHTEVRVKGVIEKKWADWFEGLMITTLSDDETVLVGELPDQAALYGLLARLRDLRFDLRSVQIDETESPPG